MDMIQTAKVMASRAHEGQVRKKTGDPYINHPHTVAGLVSHETTEDEVIAAAFLHDVLEDSDLYTYQDIVIATSKRVADLVLMLSRKTCNDKPPHEVSYLAYIKSITDYDALLIKKADLTHNMSDLEEDDPLMKRYIPALKIITKRIVKEKGV